MVCALHSKKDAYDVIMMVGEVSMKVTLAQTLEGHFTNRANPEMMRNRHLLVQTVSVQYKKCPETYLEE